MFHSLKDFNCHYKKLTFIAFLELKFFKDFLLELLSGVSIKFISPVAPGIMFQNFWETLSSDVSP